MIAPKDPVIVEDIDPFEENRIPECSEDYIYSKLGCCHSGLRGGKNWSCGLFGFHN